MSIVTALILGEVRDDCMLRTNPLPYPAHAGLKVRVHSRSLARNTRSGQTCKPIVTPELAHCGWFCLEPSSENRRTPWFGAGGQAPRGGDTGTK